jgi:anti-sigma regulatory factor (Ser/Thr protein kinase)
MIYKVNKTKADAIRFLNFVENNLTVEEARKGKLKLVLEELLMNSLHHSSKNIEPLEINIDINDSSINIEYHEYSEIFNIIEYYNKNNSIRDKINHMEEGGLGIFLILHLVKKYEFYYDKARYKNIMKFKL